MKKMILLLLLFIISFTYLIHPYVEGKVQPIYEDKLIRFHIRANSDEEEDQDLKLKIRDEILREMKDKFENAKTIKESRTIIRDNMDQMKKITEEIIKREGKDYKVDIDLAIDSFPTRKYGSRVLPTGDYETLLIKLGEAKGQNWWCVMFPPLCFVDITHSEAIDLDNLLEGEEVEIKLKWKILDLIKKFKKGS